MPSEGQISASYPTLLETENKIKLLEPFKGAKAHHQMQCLVCGHVWSATPLSKRQTLKKHGVGGCPSCNNARRDDRCAETRSASLDALRARGIEVVDQNYDGRRHVVAGEYSKVRVRNTKCGHEWECSPTNLFVNLVECGVCGPTKRADILIAIQKIKSAKWRETASEWHIYRSKVSALTKIAYNTHKKRINPNNLPRGKAGVDGAYHVDHRVPIRFCFDNNIPPEVCAGVDNLQMMGWRENLGSRHYIKGSIPLTFLNYIDVNSKLKQHAATIQKMLPGSETFVAVADIVATVYHEGLNRAVVVIPLDASQGNLKTALATKKSLDAAGIQHTILFEDELINPGLIAAKLQHYAGASVAKLLHARKLDIRVPTEEHKRTLLNENHTQGNDRAAIACGAYDGDKLVAVMTFSRPRVALGQRKAQPGYWELSRFCTDIRYRIPGVASKLLEHFKRNHEWVRIYSYADKRWSVGNMYTQLGFTLTVDNPPDYTYVVDGRRRHRWNYRKDVIKHTLENYDPALTEYQNMENHGFWRIWDCGTLRYDLVHPLA